MPESLRRLAITLGALAALLAVNALINPGSLSVQTRDDGRLLGVPIDILFFGSRIMLLAIGMTLVIATGGVDLSVGTIMAMSGAVAAVMVNAGASIGWAVAAALGISVLAGIGNGVLVGLCGVQPIVATLVLMVAGRGVAQIIAGMPIITFVDPSYRWIASGHFLSLPVSIWIVAIVFAAVCLLTRLTALGLMVEAVGDNPRAARMVGLPVALVILIAYMTCGICAGLAGLVDAASVTAADTYHSGLYLELDAILAVVIGGTALTGGRFSLVGSLLGALLIQTLTTTLLLSDVRPDLLTLPKAVLIVVVCLVQSPASRGALAGVFRRRAIA